MLFQNESASTAAASTFDTTRISSVSVCVQLLQLHEVVECARMCAIMLKDDDADLDCM